MESYNDGEIIPIWYTSNKNLILPRVAETQKEMVSFINERYKAKRSNIIFILKLCTFLFVLFLGLNLYFVMNQLMSDKNHTL